MIKLLIDIFGSNIKGRYSNKIYYLTEIFAIFISLCIYYYTSKAFAGHLSTALMKYNNNYFSYIVYGEIILSIPIFFLEGSFRQLETAYYEGIWETYDSFPLSDIKKLFIIISYGLFPVLLRTSLTIMIAMLFFDLKAPLCGSMQVLFFQILAIPAFLAPGIIACSIWIATGRGRGVIGYFTTILGLLSGALFPISVFPLWLQNISYYLSPFTFLLENSRLALATTMGFQEMFSKSFIMLLWALLLPLSFKIFSISKKRYYKNNGINTMIR